MKPKNEVQQIEQLSNEITQAIIQRQNKKVVSLYKRAEQLFSKGNDYTQALIANKLIYSITQLLEMNYSWGREYLGMLPVQLKKEYYSQIYSSGI